MARADARAGREPPLGRAPSQTGGPRWGALQVAAATTAGAAPWLPHQRRGRTRARPRPPPPISQRRLPGCRPRPAAALRPAAAGRGGAGRGGARRVATGTFACGSVPRSIPRRAACRVRGRPAAMQLPRWATGWVRVPAASWRLPLPTGGRRGALLRVSLQGPECDPTELFSSRFNCNCPLICSLRAPAAPQLRPREFGDRQGQGADRNGGPEGARELVGRERSAGS